MTKDGAAGGPHAAITQTDEHDPGMGRCQHHRVTAAGRGQDLRAAGDEVEEGDVLVVVESMKMELAVQSPAAGTVAEVLVAAGEQVERGQTLVLMGEDGDPG